MPEEIIALFAIEDDVWGGEKCCNFTWRQDRAKCSRRYRAVVTHDVESITVVGGVPARVIGKRY